MTDRFSGRWADIPFKPRRWPFYYGWVIVCGASLSIIASIPGQTIGVGVFVDYLVGALRLSRDHLSTAYLIGTIASSVTMPFAGRLLDRLGTRIMGVVASLGLGVSLLGFAYCARLSPAGDVAWLRAMITVGALFFCIRFFGQGMLTLVGRVMLARWFNYRRGLATSISNVFVSVAFTGGGAWVLNEMAMQLGWRGAYLTQFVAIGLVHALFAWLFFRDNPEQCGLPQDGFGYTPRKQPDLEVVEAPDLTAGQAARTLSFWAFNAGLAVHALLMTAIAFHLTSIGAEAGLDRARAYLVLLPMPVFSISGSFFCGWLCDRYDQKWSLTLMMAFLAFGITGLHYMATPWGKIMVMSGLGLSGGCFGVLSTVVWPHYFGKKHLGAINGASMFLVVFASALGPKFFSHIQEISGSFDLVLKISCLLPLAVIGPSLFVKRPVARTRDARL